MHRPLDLPRPRLISGHPRCSAAGAAPSRLERAIDLEVEIGPTRREENDRARMIKLVFSNPQTRAPRESRSILVPCPLRLADTTRPRRARRDGALASRASIRRDIPRRARTRDPALRSRHHAAQTTSRASSRLAAGSRRFSRRAPDSITPRDLRRSRVDAPRCPRSDAAIPESSRARTRARAPACSDRRSSDLSRWRAASASRLVDHARSSPSGEADDVLPPRHCVGVAVGGVHAPRR